ncbi:uncharacterized protein LOC106405837 isoform X4 [Brassica napus]|uniref:uncharacterized protein LOC106405837 isoform X4 n=1 Tax=Brassica napus TaxID=3708 RepID=UPI00207A645B|nr:uncharacterized protein LOC106405837 isoform X4 [Brassica napus]
MIRAFFLFLVFFIIGTQVHAQLIPPSKPDGFVYPPGRRVDPDTILIEAFYDPVCPYSRDSWPPLKQAPKHYGSRVSLLLHLLPLPYHDNAYVTSRALHIANTHNANATFSLLEGFFKHQAMFYGAQTQLLTRPEVVGRIVKLGTATLGNSYRHVLKSGFNDTKSERATRVSFKHSTSRGVYGTPTFYVNGFKLPDADTPSELGGWKKIIDSLIHPQKKSLCSGKSGTQD